MTKWPQLPQDNLVSQEQASVTKGCPSTSTIYSNESCPNTSTINLNEGSSSHGLRDLRLNHSTITMSNCGGGTATVPSDPPPLSAQAVDQREMIQSTTPVSSLNRTLAWSVASPFKGSSWKRTHDDTAQHDNKATSTLSHEPRAVTPAHILKPQPPYWTPFSVLIKRLVQILPLSSLRNRFHDEVDKPMSMELCRGSLAFAMKETEGCKRRDMRAIRWLIDNLNDDLELLEGFAGFPGSFKEEQGRGVWKGVVRDDQPTFTLNLQTQRHPSLSSSQEGITVHNLCRAVQYLLKTYHNEGYFMDMKERRRRMRLCVEIVASLVCCAEVELGLFGEVGEVLSELGNKERTNDPLTIRSNPSFAVSWTCLSLVAIWKMLDSDSVQEAARFALGGITQFRTDYGGPDTMPLTAALRIDDYLTRAWTSVLDLHLAFRLWRNRTESEIKEILYDHEASISELEHIEIEALDLKGNDWRISLLQETMDEATHKLTRRLPGVFFTELKPVASIMISEEAFDFSPVETTPVPPQLIFPGQQIQSLCTFGGRFRDILEGQNTERYEESLGSLESLHEIPVALRGLNYLMKRQLWRLMDLRDGGGLGFTIELFFLSFRQFSPTPEPTPSSSELKNFYTGTFKVITSNWKTKNSVGTLQILLDLLCDLVILNRGIFSNLSYPSYIVDMLLGLVGEMVEEHIGSPDHIDDVIQELEDTDSGNSVDNGLRAKLLSILPRPTTGSGPAQAQAGN